MIDIEELILKEEMSEVLRAAIRKLKPQQQELISALYLSECPMSRAEYGKQKGIEETSVQQNARRVKSKLREIKNRGEFVTKLFDFWNEEYGGFDHTGKVPTTTIARRVNMEPKFVYRILGIKRIDNGV